ncbi:MAG: DNA-directed RNA polymerase [Candidatus Micrarchaeota archaeon]|nr:DNA-directed RNA polymerase [Candidatus Micrarchaeota archaeon]MCX8154235.1 DNA-directed RNA polymerase [Candidatus Micrarchaeota archaeon]
MSLVYRIVEAEEYVKIPSHMLNMNKDEAVREVLLNQYKNKYFETFGLVLDIIDVNVESENVIMINDPKIYFKTRFKLLSFTLDRKEVFLGIVREITDFGAFVLIGPFEGLLNISQISDEKWIFNKEKKRYENTDKTKTLEIGDLVYVKVSSITMKEGPAKAKISLTCRSAGLGNLKWIEQAKLSTTDKKVKKR